MRVVVRRQSSTDRVVRALRRAGVDGPRTAAERWAEDARRRVRVDTGATRASITAANGTVSAGGAARWLEFGTRSQAARPFLRPGRADARVRLAEAFRGVFR